MSDVERTGRHIVVDGRRWRATDPSIPGALRAELVAELMDARREIGRLKRPAVEAEDEAAIARARRRVHDAKVALGERGAPWWEPMETEDLEARTDASVRALLRHRPGSICPSDVARIVGGAEWRPVMETVRARGASLVASGVVEVTQGGRAVDATATAGPVRWQRGPSFDEPL